MIGLIVGLGPRAGADLFERVLTRSGARSDEEHPHVVAISDPRIPSRTGHLQRGGPSPAPALSAVARRLEAAGAEVIGIGSVTTHAYRAEVQAGLHVPVVDLPREVGLVLERKGAASVAIFGTSAAAELGVLQAGIPDAIDVILPPPCDQSELDALIDELKAAADEDVSRARLTALLERDWVREVDVALVACTDLAPVSRSSAPTLVVSDILADALLREAGHPPAQ